MYLPNDLIDYDKKTFASLRSKYVMRRILSSFFLVPLVLAVISPFADHYAGDVTNFIRQCADQITGLLH